MSRKRFNRNAVASSAGNYVRNAHKRMLEENHANNEAIRINISIRIPPKYFVHCWGKKNKHYQNGKENCNKEFSESFG